MSWTSSWHDKGYHVMNNVHDMMNLLYYEYWTDKQKYLYESFISY